MSFGVEEILDPLDLQASILVGDDVRNVYQLLSRFHSSWVLHPVGAL